MSSSSRPRATVNELVGTQITRIDTAAKFIAEKAKTMLAHYDNQGIKDILTTLDLLIGHAGESDAAEETPLMAVLSKTIDGNTYLSNNPALKTFVTFYVSVFENLALAKHRFTRIKNAGIENELESLTAEIKTFLYNINKVTTKQATAKQTYATNMDIATHTDLKDIQRRYADIVTSLRALQSSSYSNESIQPLNAIIQDWNELQQTCDDTKEKLNTSYRDHKETARTYNQAIPILSNVHSTVTSTLQTLTKKIADESIQGKIDKAFEPLKFINPAIQASGKTNYFSIFTRTPESKDCASTLLDSLIIPKGLFSFPNAHNENQNSHIIDLRSAMSTALPRLYHAPARDMNKSITSINEKITTLNTNVINAPSLTQTDVLAGPNDITKQLDDIKTKINKQIKTVNTLLGKQHKQSMQAKSSLFNRHPMLTSIVTGLVLGLIITGITAVCMAAWPATVGAAVIGAIAGVSAIAHIGLPTACAITIGAGIVTGTIGGMLGGAFAKKPAAIPLKTLTNQPRAPRAEQLDENDDNDRPRPRSRTTAILRASDVTAAASPPPTTTMRRATSHTMFASAKTEDDCVSPENKAIAEFTFI